MVVRGSAIYSSFNTDHITDTRRSMMALTSVEFDMVILGQLSAGTNVSDMTVAVHRTAHVRHKPYTTYFHQGNRIFLDTFLFVRVPGYSRSDIRLLLSSTSKREICNNRRFSSRLLMK